MCKCSGGTGSCAKDRSPATTFLSPDGNGAVDKSDLSLEVFNKSPYRMEEVCTCLVLTIQRRSIGKVLVTHEG